MRSAENICLRATARAARQARPQLRIAQNAVQRVRDSAAGRFRLHAEARFPVGVHEGHASGDVGADHGQAARQRLHHAEAERLAAQVRRHAEDVGRVQVGDEFRLRQVAEEPHTPLRAGVARDALQTVEVGARAADQHRGGAIPGAARTRNSSPL